MKGRYFAIAAFLVVAAFLTGVAMYSKLPAQVPVHWNLQGQADRFDSRATAITVLPCVMAGIVLLFAALPWLSPKQFEINGNTTYLRIMLVVLGGMFYFHGARLLLAREGRVDILPAMMMGICLLITAMAFFLPKLPRNFYIGVRTPWTIADSRVWAATHIFAARTFLFAGVAGAAFAFIPRPHASMVTLAAGVLAPVIYSLVYYKQLEHRGQV